MKNWDEQTVEIDGERYDIVFSSDLDDAKRAEWGMPALGAKCACERCACTNEADCGSAEHPICGCCLSDCPDVHPEAEGGRADPASGTGRDRLAGLRAEADAIRRGESVSYSLDEIAVQLGFDPEVLRAEARANADRE